MIGQRWLNCIRQGIRDIPLLTRQWFEIPFRFRTLFVNFLGQEIRARYAGSMGGMLWTILIPLANLLIFIFVFSAILLALSRLSPDFLPAVITSGDTPALTRSITS